jgi:hypothetical protein
MMVTFLAMLILPLAPHWKGADLAVLLGQPNLGQALGFLGGSGSKASVMAIFPLLFEQIGVRVALKVSEAAHQLPPFQ